MLEWLTGLTPVTLYVVLAMLAVLENVFPPAPSDTIIAFGTFLAARGQASLAWCFASVVLGHLIGASIVYTIGRRWGADRVRRWLTDRGERAAEETFERFYQRYGTAALLVVRFIPFVRAVVPLVGGAMRISPWVIGGVVLLHAFVLYGFITWAAYSVGANFELLLQMLKRGGMTVAILAVTVVALGALWWWRRRRRVAVPRA